jgi:hypothetical protein
LPNRNCAEDYQGRSSLPSRPEQARFVPRLAVVNLVGAVKNAMKGIDSKQCLCRIGLEQVEKHN